MIYHGLSGLNYLILLHVMNKTEHFIFLKPSNLRICKYYPTVDNIHVYVKNSSITKKMVNKFIGRKVINFTDVDKKENIINYKKIRLLSLSLSYTYR